MSLSSVEVMFCQAYLRKLQEREQQVTEHLVNQVLPAEEYATNVGVLRGIRESKALFEGYVKAYFKNE